MFSSLSGFEIGVVLVSIIVSMAVHEAMHGYAAYWLGDNTAELEGRLTLNPLKHLDIYTSVLMPMALILAHLPPFFAAKPVPFNPSRVKYDEFGVAIIGVVGPLTNLVLAAAAGLIFQFWGADQSSTIYNIIVLFTQVNVAFFVFNMIPFPPLDGSRVLYAFAPQPVQEFMMRIEQFGFVAIVFFVLIVFQFISGPIVNIETAITRTLLGL